jgi:hypothetical protein
MLAVLADGLARGGRLLGAHLGQTTCDMQHARATDDMKSPA